MQTIPELLFQIESDMLLNLITYLKKGKATPAAWEADRLKDFGALSAKNARLINKYKEDILNGAMGQAKATQSETLKRVDTIYSKAIERGIDLAPPLDKISPTVQAITAQYAEQGGYYMNYTMQSLLNGANSLYRETIEQTTLKFTLGNTTLDTALKETCTKWINQGGIKILDSTGRNWSTEAYSRMVLITSNKNIATNIQLQRNREYGNDLIEVSSHSGARKLCAPYQGKIYSQTGKDKKYPPLSSTSYGEPAGLFGINCHHIVYPFIPGVSAKRYDPAPFNEDEYNLSQEQRLLERKIRDNKRKLALQQELGNEEAVKRARAAVRASQANMRGFIDKSGRTRYYNREQIFT